VTGVLYRNIKEREQGIRKTKIHISDKRLGAKVSIT
jgi:hypothetical protein